MFVTGIVRHIARGVILALFAAILPAVAVADMGLEILSLRHRQADEVLREIRPFLAPGASATAANEKILIRTTTENLAEVRRLVDSLDRAPRRLLVRVSQDRNTQSSARGAEITGDIALGRNVRIIQPSADPGALRGGARVEVRRGDSVAAARLADSQASGWGAGSQSVQVVEGGRAFIQIGVSLPLPLRQVVTGPQGRSVSTTVVYRDIGQGFYVEPRLVGDRVSVEISQQADTPAPGPVGAANVQRLATTVSGRLGEWIALGGTVREGGTDSSAGFGSSSREGRDSRTVWLRVEELP